MKLPQMTTRRWMLAIGLAAVLNWCGLMAWRSYRFEKIGQRHLNFFVESLESEQICLRALKASKKHLERVDREIAEHRSQRVPLEKLPTQRHKWTERDEWELQERSLPNSRRMWQRWLEKDQKELDEIVALRQERKYLAEKYLRAARRPWSFSFFP